MILGDKQQTRPGLDKSISKLSMLSSGSAFSSSQLQVTKLHLDFLHWPPMFLITTEGAESVIILNSKW